MKRLTLKRWRGIMAALEAEWCCSPEHAAEAMAVFFHEEVA